MKTLRYTILALALCSTAAVSAQIDNDDDDDWMDRALSNPRGALDGTRQRNRADFEAFRKQAMADFIKFVEESWDEFGGKPPVPKPKEEPVPPVVMPVTPDYDPLKPIEDNPIKVIGEVVKPTPVLPQPKPIAPIREIPKPPVVVKEKTVTLTYFGTPLEVRFDEANAVHLQGLSEKQIANGLRMFTDEAYNNLLIDCLHLRDSLQLCDWAYLLMLRDVSNRICGKGTNEAVLTLAFLYMQSGYKMRLGTDKSRLYMLYGSDHMLYDVPSYYLDNVNYYGLEMLPPRMNICNAAFPKENSLSLYVTKSPRLSMAKTGNREIVSKRYSDCKVSLTQNKNLIDFFGTYPTSMLGDNMMTRWQMYADTPMSQYVAKQIYPTLRQQLQGKSQLDQVSRLLNLIQTGLIYEYDDKVWGGDRAFFPEESLFYDYCDCEDRSILFTRLVRDLVGLDCILVYYPGHLAAAVNFTEGNVTGDYLMVNGRKFIVADATYINAPVGKTMPGMNNLTAQAIVVTK